MLQSYCLTNQSFTGPELIAYEAAGQCPAPFNVTAKPLGYVIGEQIIRPALNSLSKAWDLLNQSTCPAKPNRGPIGKEITAKPNVEQELYEDYSHEPNPYSLWLEPKPILSYEQLKYLQSLRVNR